MYKIERECLYQFPKGAFNLKEYDLWLEKKKNRNIMIKILFICQGRSMVCEA